MIQFGRQTQYKDDVLSSVTFDTMMIAVYRRHVVAAVVMLF